MSTHFQLETKPLCAEKGKSSDFPTLAMCMVLIPLCFFLVTQHHQEAQAEQTMRGEQQVRGTGNGGGAAKSQSIRFANVGEGGVATPIPDKIERAMIADDIGMAPRWEQIFARIEKLHPQKRAEILKRISIRHRLAQRLSLQQMKSLLMAIEATNQPTYSANATARN